jgi:ribosomal protein S18 acetylase RimI-like enzyme
MVEIRVAQSGDSLALSQLLGELGYPAEAGAMQHRLEALLGRDDCAVLVAIEDEHVIGLGAVHVFPILHEDVPRGQLTALVVLEPARGRGIGRELVRQLERFARARGVQQIVVATANHRTRTHRFYEELGYQWTGRRYARALEA